MLADEFTSRGYARIIAYSNGGPHYYTIVATITYVYYVKFLGGLRPPARVAAESQLDTVDIIFLRGKKLGVFL